MATRDFNSDKDISKLPIEAKRYEVADASKTGLRLRVSPAGTKTYIWRARVGQRTKIETIGNAPAMGINEARKRLDKLKTEYKDSAHLVRSGDRKKPQTVGQLITEYQTTTGNLSDSRRQQHDIIFRVWVLPMIGTDKLRSLKSARIMQVIEKAVGQGYHERARQIRGLLRKMFRYAQVKDYIDHSPAEAIETSFCGIKRPTSKETMLTAEEIPAFWAALNKAGNMSDPVRIGIKILLLSGVRSGELIQAQWQHVDFNKAQWVIPVENSKTTGWTVPLSTHLLTLFKALHHLTADTPFLMPGKPKEAEGVVTAPMDRKVFYVAVKRLYAGGNLDDIQRISPHDLRRTMRTAMGETLDITDDIGEACLNHSRGGVHGAYNKSKLLTQRGEALQKWGDYVDLLTTERVNVVLLDKSA